MIMTDKQREEMKEAAKPLIEFLRKHTNPHYVVQVDWVSATLRSDVCRTVEEEKKS